MHMKNDNEKSKNEVKKRFERKRYLNVIYFIDSNRTRTLKFSIGTSYLTVGLLGAAVIWSIVSATLLVRDRFVIAKMQDHTQSLLELVFNYQTRYDEVYEKAYPDKESSLLNVAKEEEKENAKTVKASTPAGMSLSAKTAPAIAREKIASQAAAAAVAAATPPAVAVPNNEPPLSIDNFSTQINEQTLLIRLSLKNLTSPHKAAGSVTAVANFVDREKTSYALESHPRATGDEALNDEHFNIRYFKNKAFYFEAPKGMAGTFIDVTVTVKDDKGHSKDFQYPLNKEVKGWVEKPKIAQKQVVPPVRTTVPTPAEAALPAPVTSPIEPESAPIVKATEPVIGDEATAAPTDSRN